MMLGSMHSESWNMDPKHLGFVLARYKFVAKMLVGKIRVLEIGCGDTTGSRIVKEAVVYLEGIDIDAERMNSSPSKGTKWEIPVTKWNILDGRIPHFEPFDAIYALDVMEHIEPRYDHVFLHNIKYMLNSDGVCIIGMPSLESQIYASQGSKDLHVNCKTESGLRETLLGHFSSVFMFGLNDETLHTGFGPMCHYRLAICTV
jgi:2-polyprenyl-3-methyl-5-hydroxy-6-metoxy-1,4-benzoquinol methylase